MCKKLKGRIDLDQCEQVDAGLTFESKKTSYQYMFDIRTPKRTYYLVAETEAEMNKWVECICSVCGLKIHIEEDFLMPQDASSSNTSTCTTSTSCNPADAKNSSNPYIPISECHTGKPVLNGNLPTGDGCGDLPKEPPPPPPTNNDWNLLTQPLSDEFYDYPKPLNHGNVDMHHAVETDDTYKVPLQIKSDSDVVPNDVFSTLPPRVNWNTHPEDCFTPHSSTVPRRKTSSKSDVAEYDVVPSFHGSIKEIKPQQKIVQSLANHFESLTLKSSPDMVQLNELQESSSNYVNEVISVPPRPPKPSKLKERHRYENFELPIQVHREEDKNNYDVPLSSKVVTATLSKQTPQPTFPFLKAESGDDLSPSTKVPLSASASKEIFPDDTYDFPKFRSEENINATVPLPQTTGTSQRPRRHAYTNAPPGLFNSKDLIFNYEYRPSLMTSDGYLSGDAIKSLNSSGDAATPPSPSAIGAYANVPTSPTLAGSFQSDIPPAVNRNLKPKRVLNSEDRAPVSFLTLQPPPVCRSKTKANKRSFRKPRAAPSPTPGSALNGMPPVPNRFRHHPDIPTTSDDELSNSSDSRRNSSNDDQIRHPFSAPNKKDEIQYLDLDLDSEPSPSPKSPERMSASTVYKKVDFVKTKAFNEMRQNVEESYRKSQ